MLHQPLTHRRSHTADAICSAFTRPITDPLAIVVEMTPEAREFAAAFAPYGVDVLFDHSPEFKQLAEIIETATARKTLTLFYARHWHVYAHLSAPEAREIEELRVDKLYALTREQNEYRVAEAA